MNLASAVIGPLMIPECARSARRGWGLLIRTLGAVALGIPALVAIWWWWMSQAIDDTYLPASILPGTLIVLEAICLVIVLVLSPAVLAGSLAGERERGSIGLLLSTSVDAREIVLGRMFGLLSIVFAIFVAGLPFLLAFAVLSGVSLAETSCLIALPLAVGFGIGGVSMAASSIARRGRNALILIYSLEAVVLVVPALLLGLLPATGATELRPYLAPWSPLLAVAPTIAGSGIAPAIATLGLWSVLGIFGVTLASFRLRPSFLALVAGKKGGLRRQVVPVVDEESPMLWKELHIERISALGWFGRLLAWLLMVYLVLGTLVVGGLAIWAVAYRRDNITYEKFRDMLTAMYQDPATFIAFLVQIAVGLRAAVTISSERERGTWDGLLASPLSGREILWGKLWGSVYSLRYMIIAILFAWGVSVALGAMDWQLMVGCVGMTMVISAYISAVGVRASLSNETATKAMSITVGVWLATGLALSALAGLALLVIILVLLMGWMVARPLGLVAYNARPWVPTYLFEETWLGLMAVSYVILTGIVVMASRARFDEIAGRLSGDGTDRPPAPLFLEETARQQVQAETPAEAVTSSSR